MTITGLASRSAILAAYQAVLDARPPAHTPTLAELCAELRRAGYATSAEDVLSLLVEMALPVAEHDDD